MSNEKQIWVQIVPGHYKNYESCQEAGRDLKISGQALSNALQRKKSCPYAPVLHNNHIFYQFNPYYRPVVKVFEHKKGEPLLRGNPKHHIGVWR